MNVCRKNMESGETKGKKEGGVENGKKNKD